MNTNTIISLIASAILLVCSAAPVYAGTPWLHTDANQIKDPAGNVVILRGIDFIDLGFLDNWEGGAFAMIDRVTNKTDTQGNSPGWYPKVFRINITPPDSVGGNWPVPFDPGNCAFYYDLLRPVVDYCKAKDIYAIIDWHYVANTYDHVADTNEFWTYIAPRFANDSHVLFELFNEPMNDLYGDWIFNNTDVNDWLSVRQDMQTWVNIVRTYAPKNLILVAGSNYAQILKPIVTYPIDGNNIVYVSHIYPGHFYNWWWSNSYPVFGRSYQDEITSCAAVYPVMMTEWGFSQSNNPNPGDQLNGTITAYGQPLMNFIEGLGISNSAWVASYDWGPPMFWPDWTLRVGEGEMGGFVKDTLYAKRNDHQPCDPTQSKINVSPTSYNFGEIELGKSQGLTVYISNTGCGPLTISAGIKTDFAFASLPPSSATIQPGETLNMETTYSPTVCGNNSAVLQINSSDVNNPVVQIPLSAKGILSPLSPGKIGVSPASFNFGEITLGQSTGLTVNISNTGSGPLIITGIGINTDFAFASLPPLSTTIQPGETLNMETAYSPTAYGNNSAVLQINSSDASNPVVQIPLSAKGVLSSLTPSSQITNILAFFDEYVKEGSLQWVSKNSSRPDYHLNILRNMVSSAKSSITRGKYTTACRQLTKIQKYFNNTNTSSDHVEGTGAVNLADAIQKLMQTLGCK